MYRAVVKESTQICRRFDEILEEEDKRLAEAEQLFLAQWNNAA